MVLELHDEVDEDVVKSENQRMVAGRRERELATLSSQDASFVIPRTALRPGTKTVLADQVDDMKSDRVRSRFVAADVARDVRHDVQAGTLALGMFVNLAATRAWTRALTRSWMILQDGPLEIGECFMLLKASKRWQRHYMRVLTTPGWTGSNLMVGSSITEILLELVEATETT